MHARRLAAPWIVLPYALFLVLPLVALVWRADGESLARGLTDAAVWSAVGVSLSTSLIAIGLCLLFGLPLAYGLAHGRVPGRRALDLLLDLANVMPPAVAGLALLFAFGRRGLLGPALGELGITLPFTPAAVVLAQWFVAGPLFVRTAALGFRSLNPDLFEQAEIDGADRWRIFSAIALPLTAPAILGGLALAWARALGEFGATILFAGNLTGVTQTMPLAIYLGLEQDLSLAITLALILLTLAGFALLIARLFDRSNPTG
ncbi:MAG: ABC transporter permease subunit [Anaerolineales bacterium]|nr:ABC transporter permease subunit [Anaerolineales bacterium]